MGRKKLDSEAVRISVADAVINLIAGSGLDSVTVRAIAREIGCSISIVQHYFSNKRDLLQFTHAVTSERAVRRVHEALARDPVDLVGSTEALLPLDLARRRDWLVWIAFWGSGVADPELAEAQRRAIVEARGPIGDCLKGLADRGRIDPATDCREAAREILLMLHAIALEAVFDPDDWSPERQKQVLARHCQRIAPLVKPAEN